MPAACGDKTCKKGKIQANSKALQCEICELWWHIACAEVTDGQYEVLKAGVQGTHWYCAYCNLGSMKVIKVLTELRKELDETKVIVKDLKGQVSKLKFDKDKLEQYTRKDNAVISNLADPHNNAEDTSALVIRMASEIGVTIEPGDISTSHRLGATGATHDRPIIVRFSRRDAKRKLMMKRKSLKGNLTYPNVYVNDDLTKSRYKISKELRNSGKRVWTQDGKILFKEDDDGEVSRIDTYEDLCKLNWNEEKMSQLGILQ